MNPIRLIRSAFAPRRLAPRAPARLTVERLEARDNPSGGLLDASWSFPTSQGGNVYATAVQPDGKVVAVAPALTNNSNFYTTSVIRMNPNGSLGTSFNGTGSTTISVTSDTLCSTVALQPDGKILVGGRANTAKGGRGPGNYEYVVVRLNSNGALDKTFGNRGVWTYDPASGLGVVTDLALLPDGSILGAGGGKAADGYGAFVAFKLTAAGSLNTSFGTGGFTTVHVGTQPDGAAKVAVTASGEIVLAGSATAAGAPTAGGCLVALTPAGQLDTNFNGTGYLAQYFAGLGQTEFTDVVAQGNTIVVTGDGWDASAALYRGLVARYTLSGALDPSFNTYDPVGNPQGTSGYFLMGLDTKLTAVGLEADGSIVVGGYGHYTASDGTRLTEGVVAHFSASGVLDASFGPNGTGLAYFTGISNESHVTMSVGPDGSLVLSGWTNSATIYNEFARFTAP